MHSLAMQRVNKSVPSTEVGARDTSQDSEVVCMVLPGHTQVWIKIQINECSAHRNPLLRQSSQNSGHSAGGAWSGHFRERVSNGLSVSVETVQWIPHLVGHSTVVRQQCKRWQRLQLPQSISKWHVRVLEGFAQVTCKFGTSSCS